MILPWLSIFSILSVVKVGSAYVYRTSEDVYTVEKGYRWEALEDFGFTSISAGVDDTAWAVTKDNGLYRFTGKRWGLIPGKIRSIASLDMNTAWAVSPSGSIYRFFNGIWKGYPGKLTYISAAMADGYVDRVEHVWGISPGNTIWYSYYQPREDKCSWKSMRKPNGLRALAIASVGDGTAFALFDVRDAQGYVVYRWNGSSWSLIDERFVSISNGSNGRVVGFMADGTIRLFSSDTMSWSTIHAPGLNPKTVSVGVRIWALSDTPVEEKSTYKGSSSRSPPPPRRKSHNGKRPYSRTHSSSSTTSTSSSSATRPKRPYKRVNGGKKKYGTKTSAKKEYSVKLLKVLKESPPIA
ncbi:hypothetical protein K7432_005403 [Basidiobolus ranarum]|uniref:Uncharacterized protein n=1 Tax=Basidiobolus ranarum TaxID=34480 RepID=A0ABR2WWK0_9FUNG